MAVATASRTDRLLEAACSGRGPDGARTRFAWRTWPGRPLSRAPSSTTTSRRARSSWPALSPTPRSARTPASTRCSRPYRRTPSGSGAFSFSTSTRSPSSTKTRCSGTRSGRARSSTRSFGRRSRLRMRTGWTASRRSSRRRTRTGRSQQASMSTQRPRRLAALVDGLGSQRLVGLVSPDQATALVEDALGPRARP